MTKEMNCCTEELATAQSGTAPTTLGRIRSWALSPQGLTITGIAAAVVGLTLGWSWVVALGVAPLILTLGPCLVMCALGLCMNMRNHADTPSVLNSGVGPRSIPSSVVQSPDD
jgi:hypothetical protein